MKNFLKLSEGWAIGSKLNIFRKARLRLTFYYIAIMMVILLITSFALYFSLTQELREDIKDSLVEQQLDAEAEQRLFVNTTNGARNTIIVGDLVVLLLVAGGSYILAGKTLSPIHEAMEAQKRFTADASHDLRTPLAIMRTENEVLLRNPIAPIIDYQNIVNSNLEEVKRMTTMVENLLILSTADQPKSPNPKQALSLKDLVLHQVSKMKLLAEQKQISLIATNIAESTVLANGEDLGRLIYNLINNAITYGNPRGKVVVEVVSNQKTIDLIVSDTGIGISSKDMPHIFERFYKVDKARQSNKGGAGLGLSIVKTISDEHMANIRVESKIGHGTKFIISFSKQS